MDLHEGFVASVFNYCDRWCERCPFTSRCRVFSTAAEMEARFDPAFAEIVGASPRPADARPLPRFVQEAIREMNEEASRAPSPEEGASTLEIPQEHASLEARTMDCMMAANQCLVARAGPAASSPADPRGAIAWYETLLPAKVHRALTGLDEESPPGARDCDGSAKVALLAIDRSLAAWRELAEGGLASAVDAAGDD